LVLFLQTDIMETEDVALEDLGAFDELNLSPRRNTRSKVRRSLFSESTSHAEASSGAQVEDAAQPSTKTSWAETSVRDILK
jgi:hypothetical protein